MSRAAKKSNKASSKKRQDLDSLRKKRMDKNITMHIKRMRREKMMGRKSSF